MTTHVRRDAWLLQAGGPWDPVTLAYAHAVREMQTRGKGDSTSWMYQAGVHGSAAPPPRGAIWNQCQHGGWFFLPWHRMYLYHFERIVRSIIVSQGGSADWTLPFWNYDGGGTSNSFPPAFREPSLPDGSANPLLVADRAPGINAGAGLPAAVTSSVRAFQSLNFSPLPAPGFGGGQVGPVHFSGLYGALELTPHNNVHVQIGGLMGDPDTAALDPIFWLHHANIDRLWSEWIAAGSGRSDPTDSGWLSSAFAFKDETGRRVQMRSRDTLDTAAQLGYTYERRPPPFERPHIEERLVAKVQGPENPPEMVGASEHHLVLAGQPASIEVPIDARTRTARLAEGADRSPRHAYLNIEDIEAEGNPGTVYAVFVDEPKAELPDPLDDPNYVGNVSFFGIEQFKNQRRDAHAHGMRHTFEITDQIRRLQESGAWDEGHLQVAFQPLSLVPPEGIELKEFAEPVSQTSPVRIGRVSLFFD